MTPYETLNLKVAEQLSFVYEGIVENDVQQTLRAELLSAMRLDKSVVGSNPVDTPKPFQNHWSEKDAILITYGDSVVETSDKMQESTKPLHTLKSFLDQYCATAFNSVHILPFYPYSSDDGFSVINYTQVNESLGGWDDIRAIANEYRLMADLVINHCSSRSMWFDNFVKGSGVGSDFFYLADPQDDYSDVVRPRTSPLLRQTKTNQGDRFVWCTFSHDQVDLDFRNPKVLVTFVKIIRAYLDEGVRIFRLDAIAFLWKEQGSNCLNLPQTHEIVRLLRTLIEYSQHDAVLITETNIPNRENLSYFGNANEAHCIYNFSLPPLLVNTLLTGSAFYLKQWMMSMPPAQSGTAYFNFIASHDGIGLRPAEGLLNDDELNALIRTLESFGGRVSMRALENNVNKPYEVNISLFDALSGTTKGKDDWNISRFLCAHAVMFGLEGIPGVYIHSLLGTTNDYEKLEHTKQNRSINRHKWSRESLDKALNGEFGHNQAVYLGLRKLLEIRTRQAAFHPNATQFTLHLGDALFGFWRQSIDRAQNIFCINNISDKHQTLHLSELNLSEYTDWCDLISDTHYTDINACIELSPYQSLWLSSVGVRT